MTTSREPGRRYTWIILAGILLSLPLAFLGLREFFELLGIDFYAPYVVLGLWLGLGVAAAFLFGFRLTGGESAATRRPAAAGWFFLAWGIITAALVVWALMPGTDETTATPPTGSPTEGYRSYLQVAQVFLTIAIAIGILRNRHRGRRFTILAIVAGAAFIALFAAATGYFL